MCKENKFVTKDIDYTGCHPDIANALKQGKAIRCALVGEEIICKSKEVMIVAWSSERRCYITDECILRTQVKPIQAKRILKDPVSIMKILVGEGWVWKDGKYPVWFNESKDWYYRIPWDHCGKESCRDSDYLPDNFYTYEEE